MTRGRAIWPYRVTFRPYMDPSRNARRFSCWHSLVAPIYTTSRGGYKDLRALLDIRALPLLLNSTALQARGRWCRCCNVAGCSAPPTRAPPCGGIWGWSGRSNKARVGFQGGNVRVVCRFCPRVVVRERGAAVASCGAPDGALSSLTAVFAVIPYQPTGGILADFLRGLPILV
jgi:hypothetical protein